jgi:hypothetical protein
MPDVTFGAKSAAGSRTTPLICPGPPARGSATIEGWMIGDHRGPADVLSAAPVTDLKVFSILSS